VSEADDINKEMKNIWDGDAEIEVVNVKIEAEGLIALMGLYYFNNYRRGGLTNCLLILFQFASSIPRLRRGYFISK